MKLLLDENLPHRLRHEIVGHDCYTVTFMGYGGLRNGKLLERAAGDEFAALITKDTEVSYQQNLSTLPLAVIVLHAPSNAIHDIRPLIPKLIQTLETIVPRTVSHVGRP